MTEEEAQKKFLELLDQRIAEEELLIQEAKEKGYWKMGLDANNDLFIAIQKKYKKLIDKLKSEVDGEPKDV